MQRRRTGQPWFNGQFFAAFSRPPAAALDTILVWRSEEHTSELQSLRHLVCRLLLVKIIGLFDEGVRAAKLCQLFVEHVAHDDGLGGGDQRGEIAALYVCFFFNDTATTEIYTLSLHDALPIYWEEYHRLTERRGVSQHYAQIEMRRSEEHTSELQSLRHLVCRLLLEKKKQ